MITTTITLKPALLRALQSMGPSISEAAEAALRKGLVGELIALSKGCPECGGSGEISRGGHPNNPANAKACPYCEQRGQQIDKLI